MAPSSGSRLVAFNHDSLPVHVDTHAEREILASCMIYPELIAATTLSTHDFWDERHRKIWAALSCMQEIHGTGGTCNLRRQLADAGQLAAVGDDYILDLTEGPIPSKDPPFDRVKLFAARRRCESAAGRLAHAASRGEHMAVLDAEYRTAYAALKIADGTVKAAPTYALLADAARALPSISTRLKTGLPTLDESMRGGVPTGSILMINGAPGSGKTLFGVNLADRWEEEGCAVLFYAGDQHAHGVVVRLAQRHGFSRSDLEAPGVVGDEARTDFAKLATGRAICVYDPYEGMPVGTLDHAVTILDSFAGDRPKVLVIDSLQTVRCIAGEGAETGRARIDAAVATITSLARRGITVVALSEVSRAAYRSGSRQLDATGLSSGKESSSIEYQGDALIVLRSVKGEPDLVDVEVAKNSRFGSGNPEFRLRLDRRYHDFSEVDITCADAAAGGQRRQMVEDDARLLTKLLATHTGGMGARALRDHASATFGWGTKRVGVALARLESGVDGWRAVNEGNERLSKWKVTLTPNSKDGA